MERSICSNSALGQLDGLLHVTYKSRLGPEFGADKTLMKKQQREWLQRRNACTSEDCITQAYKERIRGLCEMPVVSGVSPTSDCNLLR